METVQPRGLLPEQKRLFYHLFLTLFVAMAVASLLHKPNLMFPMLYTSWMVSIFIYRVAGYLAITRGVLAMGVLQYVLARFVFPGLW